MPDVKETPLQEAASEWLRSARDRWCREHETVCAHDLAAFAEEQVARAGGDIPSHTHRFTVRVEWQRINSQNDPPQRTSVTALRCESCPEEVRRDA